MEMLQNRIRMHASDPKITALLKSIGNSGNSGGASFTRHFNQNEEFFLRLDREYEVPSFPIHHDVRESVPSEYYAQRLMGLLESLVPLVPDLFRGLTYHFDPADTLRPAFFQLYRLGDAHYLYLLKIDLTSKPTEHEITRPGTNDTTAEYRSSKLFLDGIVIPIERVESSAGRIESFTVRQTVSQTWIGETGRGYFVQGIWMDHELTKFFSKLFLPSDRKTYPYYPFQCRYRTICTTDISSSSESRKRGPVLLHRAIEFVAPVMDYIQDALRDNDFSSDLEAFRELKARIGDTWNNVWNGLEITSYLNGRDMKEFLVAD